jgi:hypothetical protein
MPPASSSADPSKGLHPWGRHLPVARRDRSRRTNAGSEPGATGPTEKESRTVNKVLLTGRLTRDPELRSLASGKSVTQFSVATNEYAGGKEKAEYQCKGKVYRLTVFPAQPPPPPRHRGNRLSGSLLRAAMQGKVHHCGST